jgi:T-complex protein 1 subunit gamma
MTELRAKHATGEKEGLH